MKKLFFTGGGGAGNEAIYRLLSEKYEVHFGDADIESISCSIPKQRRHQILHASSSEFSKQLIAVCKELKIDLLIPGVDEELPFLSSNIEVPIMLPEQDYVCIMLDKLLSINAISSAGINFPLTMTVAELKNGKRFDFPCIAKPRNGRGSRNVKVLKDINQIDVYLAYTELEPEQVVLQELMNGTEYTVLMSSDSESNLHAVVPILVDVKRGITLRARTDNNQKVIDTCKAIHKALPAKGCYNIQLIYTENGQAMPFEINPRISTTFCLGLYAGVDPIEIYFGGSPADEFIPYQTDVMLRRSWVNHFITKESEI
jgi:carbamoyl-phosphate synthase large subunit